MKERPDDAVLWYEGMLLAPQHFQEMDRRQEQLHHYHSSTLDPFHWGVLSFRIDEAQLASEVLRVAEVEAIMPDGLVAVRGEGDPEVKGSLAQVKAAGQVEVMVHLVASSRHAEQREPGIRHRQTEGGAVTDMLLADSEVHVQRLQPVLQLRLGRRPLESEFTSLPIARLRFDGSKFALDRNFIPPSLRVSLDSPLGVIAGDIAALMRLKAEQLWTLETSSTSPPDAAQLLATRIRVTSLVSGLPRLEKLLATESAHPFALYQAICDAAGPFALLRREMPVPPDLPDYRHDDPLLTFTQAQREIELVIAESVSEKYTPYRFQLVDDRFNLQEPFQEGWRGRQLLLGLSRGSSTESEISAWLEQAHIGALDAIDSLRANRDPGAPRSAVAAGEADLVPSRDVTLFKLDQQSSYLTPKKPLTIANPGEKTRPREIVLYVRNSHGNGFPTG